VYESDQIVLNERGQREHELQLANDFHGVLLAMAGHDLRQPLQTIMTAYEWLGQRLDSSPSKNICAAAVSPSCD
jgi:K+-sensing histidine kinase KdpD